MESHDGAHDARDFDELASMLADRQHGAQRVWLKLLYSLEYVGRRSEEVSFVLHASVARRCELRCIGIPLQHLTSCQLPAD
jgi:hypothetical protein